MCKDSYVIYACGETKTENENDSVNQNDIVKRMLQKDAAKMMLQNDVAALMMHWQAEQTALFLQINL